LAREHTLSCTEVWGGNRATDAALVMPGLSGWVLSRPFDDAEAGGDVHYVSSCGTGRITRLILADISGHGREVAELAGRLRRLMQRYLNHQRPHRLAASLNRDMADLAEDTGRFATAVVLTFFSPRGELTLCNAGHPTPLLYRAARHQWSPIDQPDTRQDIANLPLGVLDEVGYVGRQLTLDPGDLILAYTDCLTEAMNADGHTLGQRGLRDVVSGLEAEDIQLAPSDLIHRILEAIRGQGYRLEDDLTAVVLRCTQRAGPRGLKDLAVGMWRFLKSFATPGPIPWPDELPRR